MRTIDARRKWKIRERRYWKKERSTRRREVKRIGKGVPILWATKHVSVILHKQTLYNFHLQDRREKLDCNQANVTEKSALRFLYVCIYMCARVRVYISAYVCTYPLKRTQFFFLLHSTFLDLSRCSCLLSLDYLIHNTYFMPIYRITNTRNEK